MTYQIPSFEDTIAAVIAATQDYSANDKAVNLEKWQEFAKEEYHRLMAHFSHLSLRILESDFSTQEEFDEAVKEEAFWVEKLKNDSRYSWGSEWKFAYYMFIPMFMGYDALNDEEKARLKQLEKDLENRSEQEFTEEDLRDIELVELGEYDDWEDDEE